MKAATAYLRSPPPYVGAGGTNVAIDTAGYLLSISNSTLHSHHSTPQHNTPHWTTPLCAPHDSVVSAHHITSDCIRHHPKSCTPLEQFCQKNAANVEKKRLHHTGLICILRLASLPAPGDCFPLLSPIYCLWCCFVRRFSQSQLHSRQLLVIPRVPQYFREWVIG